MGWKKGVEARDVFMSKVWVDESTGCWLWQGTKYPNGYAHFGRYGIGHRFAYRTFVGPIPNGLDLDHLCRVRRCVNPAHLEPVTRSVNLLRSPLTQASKKRAAAQAAA